MKKFVYTALLELMSLCLCAQWSEKLTPALVHQLENQPQGSLQIMVYLTHKVDYAQWQAQSRFINGKSERAKQLLQKLDENSQQQFQLKQYIDELINSGKSIEWIKSWKICNAVWLETEASTINLLASHQSILKIDWLYTYMVKADMPVSMEPATKSIGGIEPGLAAIKAPYMWSLGYTGRNQTCYLIDTGVWPNHPAIAANWKGRYVPQTYAWNGFDLAEPGDKSGSHGTHCIGSVMGLDASQNDTIGVAFHATFIAADPIVEDLSLVKPVPVLISAFEWALNPDNDPNTTDDIPQVINNSWGIVSNFDTTLCNADFVFDTWQACEAAGIAVVFSAGNNGPGSNSIGRPQYVAINPVLPFTVGALDANNHNFPIANFSSRGPTSCTVAPDLLIKPEVTAPGVNVRSAVGQNEYANYSGTSMAGPHVAGAVLLLSEAFPELGPVPILTALYQSATDLGEPGEDNSFGMGIINLEAAFELLAAEHSPAPPISTNIDIAISRISHPEAICNNVFPIRVYIKNQGLEIVSIPELRLGYENTTLLTTTIGEDLLPGQEKFFDFLMASFAPSSKEFWVKLAPVSGEEWLLNNHRYFQVYRTQNNITPYFAGFDDGELSLSQFRVINPDQRLTWDTISTGGLVNFNHRSARIRFKNYLPRSGQRDFLESPKVLLPGMPGDSLYFQFHLAYDFVNNILNDSLIVEYSTNCGSSWTPLITLGAAAMSTVDTVVSVFVPSKASHWRQYKFNLTQAVGNEPFMQVRFVSVNRGGSFLYIDNVAIYYNQDDPTTIKTVPQASNLSMHCYPNPTRESFYFDTDVTIASIKLFDTAGRLLHQSQPAARHGEIKLPVLQSGVYYLRFDAANGLTGYHKLLIGH